MTLRAALSPNARRLCIGEEPENRAHRGKLAKRYSRLDRVHHGKWKIRQASFRGCDRWVHADKPGRTPFASKATGRCRMSITPEESRKSVAGERSPLAGMMLSVMLTAVLLGCRTEQKRAESRTPFRPWPWSARAETDTASSEAALPNPLPRKPESVVPVPPPAPATRSWSPPAAPAPESMSPVHAEDFYGVRPTSGGPLEATPMLRPVPDSAMPGSAMPGR